MRENRTNDRRVPLALIAVCAVALGSGCGSSKPVVTPACAHSPCHDGGALDPNCDTDCVKKICAAYPSCCGADGGAWSGDCVALVKTYCGQRCDCENALIPDGGPFNRYACDCTKSLVCTAAGNPCCTTAWTAQCAALAKQATMNGCVPSIP